MKDEKYKLDERNHVERPLLDQLASLDWEFSISTASSSPPTPSAPIHRSHPAVRAARSVEEDQSLAGGRPGGGGGQAAYGAKKVQGVILPSELPEQSFRFKPLLGSILVVLKAR